MDETGLRHYTFNVLSVRLDGVQAPYSVSEGAGYMTGMAIGSAKTYVSKGIHTYEITYETDGHVRFMEDHDELFLNAIGTDNAFPVNKASFSLQLPAGAVIRKTDGFTGRVGSEEKAFVRTGPSSFRTTRVLRPKEAFTVLVAWNKGVVQAHESFANRIAAMRDTLSISFGGLIAMLSLYFWWIKRRTPLTVIPQFTPPQGYGPGALARFLETRMSRRRLLRSIAGLNLPASPANGISARVGKSGIFCLKTSRRCRSGLRRSSVRRSRDSELTVRRKSMISRNSAASCRLPCP